MEEVFALLFPQAQLSVGESIFSNVPPLVCDARCHWNVNSFFSDFYSRNRRSAASLKVCLLMANNALVYGVLTQTFLSYFQMSEEFGRRACREFDSAIKQCYKDEFLCLPTASDIKSIVKLHKSQHSFDRIFWSLDCTHSYWKNCPKAWHGACKGKEHITSIVLEAICDYHIFFGMLHMGTWKH